MAIYRFKPAALRSEQTWTVDQSVLSGPGNISVKLEEIQSIRFTDAYTKRTANALIALEGPGGKANIVCNEYLHGKNRAEFLRLADDLFSYLEQVNPDLQVKVGFPKVARLGIAASGFLMALFGLMIAASSSSSPRGLPILILGLALLSIGCGIIWYFAPWRPAPTISISEIRARIRDG